PAVVRPVEAPKPIEILKPAAPKPEPVQVASVAPTGSLVGMGIDNPRFPKIGDHWTYSVGNVGASQRGKVDIEVTAVSEDGIIDTSNAFGQKTVRVFGPGPFAEMTRNILNFQPYLLAFGSGKPGESWRGLQVKNSGGCMQPGTVCSFDDKVVGTEKVTTAAGTFDAVKLVIDFNGTFGTNRIWREYTYWYAEKAKRVVKANSRLRLGNSQNSDFEVELLSYQLN